MSCRSTSEYEGAQFVCDTDANLDPNGVFLNALTEGMPECDRKERAVTLDDLKEFEEPPKCYVYCAQRSCTAAQKYMEKHAEELGELCDTVSYIHGGALEMDHKDLVDGPVCHKKIIDHNMEQGLQDGCLTCKGDDRVKLKMSMNGDPVDATYLRTSGEIPDWFRRSGIVGTLPTQFSCDERYKAMPTPHDNGGSKRVKVDISNTDLPEDALIAYWAANPSEDVHVAEDAYGTFQNSGIVQCKESICEFPIDHPGRYTSEGKVFKSHIHLTEWKGDRWNLDAKTIDIE
ncbi:MAG: hypothetical protein CBC12_02835 [Candidatus Puniceispirillum sp. TMED52]|jgi:hypothetical protein|nr:MAG: hypothetical protein CBC12_02835 [Candidatus Puniceispirillum sp. TMED52]RPF82342.1 MAG: hypothetical protein CBC65_000555 [Rhodothermaceae bacterium TMED105]|tara:strand:- start:4619 stop:5482 length:864 start_codon:yes stop_codon:yes gene_type:complete